MAFLETLGRLVVILATLAVVVAVGTALMVFMYQIAMYTLIGIRAIGGGWLIP